MPDTNDNGGPRLWTRTSGFAEDAWMRADGVEDRTDNARLILPLAAFLALDGRARGRRAGSALAWESRLAITGKRGG